MQVTINGVDIEFDFSIRSINDIVQYKRFYEPHDKVTLTQYLSRVDDSEYSIDLLCDAIFYAHAIRSKNVGKQPAITYGDVAQWVFENLGQVEHVVNTHIESLPKPEEKQPIKKKTVKKPRS